MSVSVASSNADHSRAVRAVDDISSVDPEQSRQQQCQLKCGVKNGEEPGSVQGRVGV